MHNSAIIVLVVGGIAYAAYAIPVMLHFFSYCECVAATTGRTEENASLISQDDGGLNAFQREQWRQLRSGEFANGGDPVLVARGMVLARRLKVLWWAALALVLSVAATDIWPR